MEASSLVSFRNIVFAFFIGINIAAIMAIFDKRVLGDFARKLIREEALSPETAMTLSELGYYKNTAIRSSLRSGYTLRRVVRCVEEEQYNAACQFAAGLGLAFQIRDDMLDVIGTQTELGKATGVDSDKNTFVKLFGLNKCEELVVSYTNYAIDALNTFEDTSFLNALAKSLTERRT